MLFHCIRSLSPFLARSVEHLWVARGRLPSLWRNMILPDGAVELIINLGDPQKLCDPEDHARSATDSWDNAIFARKDGALTPLVQVQYLPAP